MASRIWTTSQKPTSQQGRQSGYIGVMVGIIVNYPPKIPKTIHQSFTLSSTPSLKAFRFLPSTPPALVVVAVVAFVWLGANKLRIIKYKSGFVGLTCSLAFYPYSLVPSITIITLVDWKFEYSQNISKANEATRLWSMKQRGLLNPLMWRRRVGVAD